MAFELGSIWMRVVRDPKDHTDIRILCSGSKAQDKGDTRSHMVLVGSLCLCCFLGP